MQNFQYRDLCELKITLSGAVSSIMLKNKVVFAYHGVVSEAVSSISCTKGILIIGNSVSHNFFLNARHAMTSAEHDC